MTLSLGLDFGTSNSTIGLYHPSTGFALASLEGDKKVLPSAIFYNTEYKTTHFGRDAIDHYINGEEGRLMRAFKSTLGTSLISETTQIGTKAKAITDIIGDYIAFLKQKAESYFKHDIDTVVLGRPVRFVDKNDEADAKAAETLKEIAGTCGFKHIEFQYEPIAAALNYETQITNEETALIIDIGGGTSDFSIIKLSPDTKNKTDRTRDVLANVGVHIGGTDFDTALSLAKVMPFLGYKSPLKTKGVEVPSGFFHTLSDWKKINSLYTHQTVSELNVIKREATEPKKVDRLIHVIKERFGHHIALSVEAAKIDLSECFETQIDLTEVFKDTHIKLTQTFFENTIFDLVDTVISTIETAIKLSGLNADKIDTLFFTGGSSAIPLLRRRIQALLPGTREVQGDIHAAVGLGLAKDAFMRFG